ncbi:MAG: efflux RND transporter periplasmic adaptor subunit [Pirellulales bacterium]
MNKRNLVVAGILLVGGAAVFAAWPKLRAYWSERESAADEEVVVDPAKASPYLELLPKVVELNGIRTAVVARPSRPKQLELRGQLNFDPDTLVHIRGRFPGQVISLGQVDEPNAGVSTEAIKTKRELKATDNVVVGQELGVLWSKELGEKKAELVNAHIHLRVDKENLKQLRQLDIEGAASERLVRDAVKNVEEDESDVQKARMTLRSWMFSTAEIDEVAAEAERLHKEGARQNVRVENEWARVPIVAPRDGTIVEKNIVKGDIVNTEKDLFMIADLSNLQVVAHVYEEDMFYLERLPLPIPCRVTISSMPDLPAKDCQIERLGDVIDPGEHMALVFGTIENPSRELLVGQFVKVLVEIPEEPGLVEIPTRALVEDGLESIVMVQVDPHEYRYVSRRVSVARRYHDIVYVNGKLTAQQKQEGLQELQEGEVVVAAGALELKAALQQWRERNEAQAGRAEK